jgi:hypothetical protein
MNENRTIELASIPIGGDDGFVWNCLHEEREDVSEALLKTSNGPTQAPELQELLQTRLSKIDDELDRLMCPRPRDREESVH